MRRSCAANLSRGRLSVEQLCAAIVEVSDNSAANLLLRRLGGPAGLTAFIRRSGDRVTRLDRYEEELNTNLPGDARDTTTPAAMLGLMQALLLGDVLTAPSRARLIGWMEGATTGLGACAPGFRRAGGPATRPATAPTAPPTTSPSPGPPNGRRS